MQVSLASTLFSQLGNQSSLLPLAVKDFVNSSGHTYTAYQNGGIIEGKDRFIDEFGTQAIWLGGIPLVKWILDKTLYKALDYDPQVDVRVVDSKNKDYIKLALENAPNETIKKNIQKALDNKATFKNLFYSKFAIATSLTLGMYQGMTLLKQKYIHKNIEDNYREKVANNLKITGSHSPTFSAFGRKQDNISFTSSKVEFLKSFMYDPARNTSIIDLGIEANRIGNSENSTRAGEFAIKGAGFLAVMYFAGQKIEHLLNYASAKLFHTPIELDARFLASKELQESLKDTAILKQQLNLFKASQDETSILKFLFANQDNVVVKAGKFSGVLKLVKNTNSIDTSKFIDYKKMLALTNDLEDFVKSFEADGLDISAFIKKAKSLKIGSVVANIGICCAALGYALPKVITWYRKLASGTTDFHVQKDIEAKLAQKTFEGLLG